MQISQRQFIAGQQVVVRDERWTVLRCETFDAACLLSLRGVDHANRDELQSVLAPFDVVASAVDSGRLRQHTRGAVLAHAATSLAEAAAWADSWTAVHAGIDLHEWQLAPAAAAVTGSCRILLADPVGLGKTIQAALIMAELCARGLADRVLILTPASIREQWAQELRTRFGLRPVIFDQPALLAAASTLPPEVNPWRTAPLIISSIDLVKRSDVRAALAAVPFDLLVVDEAHHITPGSDRGAIVADLCSRTPWVVLATATPHSGDEQAYAYLTHLGSVGDTLRVFRRRVDTARAAARRSRTLMVTPTASERALLDATREYAQQMARRGNGASARLLGSLIARRAASSAHAVAKTLARRIALLGDDRAALQQPVLPWEEIDGIDDDVGNAVVGSVGLADRGEELDWLKRLLDLALAAEDCSSKIAVIRRLLRRTQEQLIIFSEYRDVALHVASTLTELATVVSIHGGLSPGERQRAVHAFNSGRARTLVATDAAGEGLNLHARCRFVINMELPWTPLRLEQRIGRVDRLGQTRRVHAIHLAHRGSYEGTVIARLEKRRQRAAAMRAPVEVGECDSWTPVRRRLARAGGAGRAGRSGGAGGSACAVYASRARGRDAVILLYVTPLACASGLVVQRCITALRVELDDPTRPAHPTRPTRPNRLTRRTVRALTSHSLVKQAVHEHVQRQADQARPLLTTTSEHITRRLDSLLASLDKRAATVLWQGSLFDHRDEQAAERGAHAHAGLRDHLQRRRQAASQLPHAHAGEPRLVAAWLTGR